MSNKHNIAVGQKLWFVPSERYLGEPRFAEVLSVGRKWLKLGWQHRADIETLLVFGNGLGSPLGKCYLTREDHEVVVRDDEEWIELRRLVGGKYQRPAHLTAAQIRQCIDIINPPKAEGAE